MAAVLGGTYTREGRPRALAFAVLASIALHAALLFAGFPHRDAARKMIPAPGPISARLVEPRPVAAPAPGEPAPKPRAETPPPPAAKNRPAQGANAKAAAATQAVAERPAPMTPPIEAPPPVSDAPSRVAPSAPASESSTAIAKADPQPAAAAPASSGEALDSGEIRKYVIGVGQASKRFKQYPRVAIDNNWEGRVVVHVLVRANGINATYSVKTSSGHEVLDRIAVEMVAQGRPRTQIPPALRGREFPFDFTVVFDLKDETR